MLPMSLRLSERREELVHTDDKVSANALVRLAVNPTPEVGSVQRRTTSWLLRPFPLGLRFSGNNMSPLPAWLAGAQNVCLNFSNADLPVQLHFALFAGSGGFVLKPLDMCTSDVALDIAKEDAFWPPPHERLHRTSTKIISLHNLPKRTEQRPRFDGSCEGCHKYAPQLSGTPVPPDSLMPSSPSITITAHPIGGFCAVINTLPLPKRTDVEHTTVTVATNGMNAVFGETLHCLAAEPHATFLRFGVCDGGHEVAYETAVLGRLRQGFRVLQMRGILGTRIELCFLFVRIDVGSEYNTRATERELRIARHQQREQNERLLEELRKYREGGYTLSGAAADGAETASGVVKPARHSEDDDWRRSKPSLMLRRTGSSMASIASVREELKDGEGDEADFH